MYRTITTWPLGVAVCGMLMTFAPETVHGRSDNEGFYLMSHVDRDVDGGAMLAITLVHDPDAKTLSPAGPIQEVGQAHLDAIASSGAVVVSATRDLSISGPGNYHEARVALGFDAPGFYT